MNDFKYVFEQMQADLFSRRLEDEYSICFEFYKLIREQCIQTLFNKICSVIRVIQN